MEELRCNLEGFFHKLAYASFKNRKVTFKEVEGLLKRVPGVGMHIRISCQKVPGASRTYRSSGVRIGIPELCL